MSIASTGGGPHWPGGCGVCGADWESATTRSLLKRRVSLAGVDGPFLGLVGGSAVGACVPWLGVAVEGWGECRRVQRATGFRMGCGDDSQPWVCPVSSAEYIGVWQSMRRMKFRHEHIGSFEYDHTRASTLVVQASASTCQFFLFRTALKDRPKGPPTANHQPPPTTNRQPLPTATNHQSPSTNRRQPPPTDTNCQSPTANRQSPPTADRQSPQTIVENMTYMPPFCKTAVQEHTPPFFSSGSPCTWHDDIVLISSINCLSRFTVDSVCRPKAAKPTVSCL